MLPLRDVVVFPHMVIPLFVGRPKSIKALETAMEGDRKGLKDDKLPHLDMREVELADAVIRIFDLAGAYGMRLGDAIAQKMAYNAQRADHKPEARAAAGGKAY